jgi:hypothetical protein
MDAEKRFKKLVTAFQNTLASAELQALYERRAKRDLKQNRHVRYKLIKQLSSMKVRMDGTKNHARPHLHSSIVRKNHAASIAIDSGIILVGKLTKLQEREVQR